MPARSPARPCGRLPSPGRRVALRAALGAGVGLLAGSSIAAGFELRVVTAGDDSATRQILEALARRLPGFHAASDVRGLAQRRGPAVYLALGAAALQAALDAGLDGPLLSLFTSNEAFTRVLGSSPRQPRAAVSAIHAEASPHSQMMLIRTLYARRVGVGVLLTESTAAQEEALRRAARSADLDIDVQLVERGENAVRALTRVVSSTVLLAVPDRDLYTVDNLRNLLESTYRRGQGVIGFSASLVNAGTLAAAYSSIDDTVAQVGEVAAALAAGRLPDPQYPRYWRVAINDSVARSLNVVVSDAARRLGNFPPPP